MTKDEALEQALKALIRADRISGYPNNADEIFAIKEVLANVASNDTSEKRVDETQEHQHEPVAWMFQHEENGRMNYVSNDGMNTPELFLKMNPRYVFVCALYTTPPQRQWVGLTAGEILDTLISVDEKTVRLPSMLGQFAWAIEAKLKEKNT